MFVNHYDILGVQQTAPIEVIRGAYKALSQRWHPDREDGDSDRMAAINRAWFALSDVDRREAHDMQISFILPPSQPKAPKPKPPIIKPWGSAFEIDEALLKKAKVFQRVQPPRKAGQYGGLTAVFMRVFGG